MGRSVKIGAIIIIVAVLAGGIAWALGSDSKTEDDQTSTSSQSANTQSQTTKENSNEAVAATITYTSSGFTPEITTVKSGDTVRVVSTTDNQLEFESDPHPTHTDNPELNIGDIENGQSKTFTVTTKGDWGFHNHFNPSNHAFLKVE